MVRAFCFTPAVVLSRRCLPVLLGLALLAGCGGEEEPEPEPAAKALPGSPPEVEASLLTVDELGDGWVDLGPTPFEERGFGGCPATNVLTAEQDEQRVGEAQTYYSQGEPPAPTVFFESVSLWGSSAVAAERLAVFATASAQCVGVRQELLDGRPAIATFTDRAAPQLGDEAVALTVELQPEDGPDLFLDMVAVRVGEVIVFTNGERYADEPEAGLDPSQLDELSAEAVAKVEQTLPT